MGVATRCVNAHAIIMAMAQDLTMLCIGTATQDVFLIGKDIFKPIKEHGKEYEHLPLGAKLMLDDVIFSTGGNAMNAAITFARQSLESEFMGIIGTDPAGQSVLARLDEEGIATQQLVQDASFQTSYSTILLAPTGERTILNFHGTRIHDDGSPLKLDAIARASWLYLSSVGSVALLEKIIDIAARHKVKVAINPSSAELAEAGKLRALLEDVDILLANKEEMQQLVEGTTSEELVRHASHLVPIAVVSDGPHGVVATDNKVVVKAGLYEDVKVINRLGAGDAFGSGFVAAIAQGQSLQEAVIFASANSTSVVTKIGATAGILHRGAALHDMPLEVEPF